MKSIVICNKEQGKSGKNKTFGISESADIIPAKKSLRLVIFSGLPIEAKLILEGKILAIFCVIPDQKSIYGDLPTSIYTIWPFM